MQLLASSFRLGAGGGQITAAGLAIVFGPAIFAPTRQSVCDKGHMQMLPPPHQEYPARLTVRRPKVDWPELMEVHTAACSEVRGA